MAQYIAHNATTNETNDPRDPKEAAARGRIVRPVLMRVMIAIALIPFALTTEGQILDSTTY